MNEICGLDSKGGRESPHKGNPGRRRPKTRVSRVLGRDHEPKTNLHEVPHILGAIQKTVLRHELSEQYECMRDVSKLAGCLPS